MRQSFLSCKSSRLKEFLYFKFSASKSEKVFLISNFLHRIINTFFLFEIDSNEVKGFIVFTCLGRNGGNVSSSYLIWVKQKKMLIVTRWVAFVSVGVGVGANQRIPLSVLARNPYKGLVREISH